MTTILAPAQTSTADRIVEALATYADEHGLDQGGGHQRTMLLAACLVRLFDVDPGEAIDLARNAPYDPRVSVADDAREEALDRARRAREYAEHGDEWTPQPRDVVTHNGTDGTWIVHSREDEDTVWIHRPDAPSTVEVSGWGDAPESLLLAVVDELRPASPAAVTR